MKRKVNRVGTNTLTVSLPSKWAQKYGVKVGDEVDVEENDFYLSIKPDTVSKKIDKTLTIKIPSYKLFMKRIFHNPYSKGYNSLKVISDDIKVIAEVQKLMLNYYSGFEIIEQNPGYIVIKNISKTNNEEFSTVQNRLINITLNMANEVIEVMKNNDPNILDSVIQMEKIAQRCHLLCKRMLNTQINLYKDYMNTNLYRINGLIEEITDCQRDICKEVINSKRTNQKTIKIAKSCVSLLKVCFNCFQKFNMESILELKSQEKLLKDQLEDVMKNKIDVESNSYMKMIVDKVHHMSEEFN